jgi:hypothetical protein
MSLRQTLSKRALAEGIQIPLFKCNPIKKQAEELNI